MHALKYLLNTGCQLVAHAVKSIINKCLPPMFNILWPVLFRIHSVYMPVTGFRFMNSGDKDLFVTVVSQIKLSDGNNSSKVHFHTTSLLGGLSFGSVGGDEEIWKLAFQICLGSHLEGIMGTVFKCLGVFTWRVLLCGFLAV